MPRWVSHPISSSALIIYVPQLQRLRVFDRDDEVVVKPNRATKNWDASHVTVAAFKRLINSEWVNDSVLYAFTNVLHMRTPQSIALLGSYFIDALWRKVNVEQFSTADLASWFDVS
jgi:Ulp1 family protease